MSVLTELLATSLSFESDGVKYTRDILTAFDYARIEAVILEKRPDPVVIARRLAEGQPPEVKKEILGKGYDDAKKAQQVTARELDAYLGSLEGEKYQFYLSLRTAHPDMTEEKACELQEKLCRDFMVAALAALAKQFPDASEEELTEAAAAESEAGMGQLIRSTMGLPEGNSETPEKPGTPTSPCPGENGSTHADNSTAGTSTPSVT